MEMKTRTNQPVEYAFDSAVDFEHLSDAFLSNLKAGDVVVKQTGEQKHSYIVSFKKDDEGMCLTYTDASVVETISYDLVDGHWVFNSKDVTPIGARASGDFSGVDLKAKTLEQTQSNETYELDIPTIENLTFEERYCKAMRVNNFLIIVLSFSLKNETSASVAATQFDISFDVSNDVGDKLYCVNGEKVSDNYTTNIRLCEFALKRGDSFSGVFNTYIAKIGKNRLAIRCNSSVTISPNELVQYIGRIDLNLLP